MATGDYKITKVADNDPMRCQAVVPTLGQCHNNATVQGGYCAVHGGNKAIEKQKKENIRNYQLTKWQARLNRFADAPNIKNLRDEIAITRMVLEERLNTCKDEHDLVMHSHQISDLVIKIEKLVGTCHKLEGSMGQLLDKQAILNFASDVIKVISNEISDENILDRIADGIMGLMGSNSDASTEATTSE